MRARFHVSNDPVFLTIGQVRERYGVSDMWVFRYTRDHGFPAPIKFGRTETSARRWRVADLIKWEDSRGGYHVGEQTPAAL